MKTATFVKNLKGFTGYASLYKLSEPLMDNEYVVVSATHAMHTGAETFIFPADSEGKVTDWGELEGSYRGGLSHEEALEGAGYSIG